MNINKPPVLDSLEKNNNTFEEWKDKFPLTRYYPEPSDYRKKFMSLLPKDIIGSKIIAFGHLGFDWEGGGIGLRYKTKKGKVRTLLFEFNENGMWDVSKNTYKRN